MTNEPDAEFSALVRRQSRFVFRVAYAVLLNPHDAEDAVQETFLKLYRSRTWEHAENERAYLARVAWRTAVDRLRSSRRAQSVTEVELPVEGTEAQSPNANPEQLLVAENRSTWIHSLIDALPEELRVPLVLSAFEELNSREIAGILAIPEGTVRTRLQRARQMLRQKLEAVQVRMQETRHA